MELEKEIKQKHFNNEYQKVIVNILFTSSWLGSLQLKFFKPYQISTQQYNILRILRGQYPNPASVNLLIDRMLDKTSNASRLVEKLKLKELVERKECATDKRQVDVTITEKGLKMLEEIDAKMTDFERNMQTLSAEDAKQLNRLLDKMRG